jgi:AcrR family transcriptional regulator
MTKASLYYHFESKQQILEAVTGPLRAEMADFIARMTAPPRPAPGEPAQWSQAGGKLSAALRGGRLGCGLPREMRDRP